MTVISRIKTLLSQCNNDSVTVHLFLHLLITSDSSGTVATTLQKLALELRTTVDKIRIRLAKLEGVNLITSPQSSHKNPIKIPRNGTVITICNYESYTVLELCQSHKNPIKIPPNTHEPKETKKENIPPTPPIKEKNKENIIKPSLSGGQKESSRFQPPTISEVQNYILEKGYSIAAERFIDFYQSKNWYVGKNKMKDWKAAVRNWAARDKEQNGQRTHTTSNTDRERIIRERQEQHLRDIEKLNADYLAKIGQNPG